MSVSRNLHEALGRVLCEEINMLHLEIIMSKLAQGEAAGEDITLVCLIKAGRPIGYQCLVVY